MKHNIIVLLKKDPKAFIEYLNNMQDVYKILKKAAQIERVKY